MTTNTTTPTVPVETKMTQTALAGAGTAFVAWFYIWPLASSVTERLAVLSFVFVVLITIGYQVKGFAQQIVTGLFYMRRKRKTKAKK